MPITIIQVNSGINFFIFIHCEVAVQHASAVCLSRERVVQALFDLDVPQLWVFVVCVFGVGKPNLVLKAVKDVRIVWGGVFFVFLFFLTAGEGRAAVRRVLPAVSMMCMCGAGHTPAPPAATALRMKCTRRKGIFSVINWNGAVLYLLYFKLSWHFIFS